MDPCSQPSAGSSSKLASLRKDSKSKAKSSGIKLVSKDVSAVSSSSSRVKLGSFSLRGELNLLGELNQGPRLVSFTCPGKVASAAAPALPSCNCSPAHSKICQLFVPFCKAWPMSFCSFLNFLGCPKELVTIRHGPAEQYSKVKNHIIFLIICQFLALLFIMPVLLPQEFLQQCQISIISKEQKM